MKNETSAAATAKNEKLQVLRNIVYLLPFKVFLLLLISVLMFNISSLNMHLLQEYSVDRASVRNALIQRSNFDYRTSETFLDETKTLLDTILQYALVYQDLENFVSPDLLQTRIAQETERMEEQIAVVLYLAGLQAESGDLKDEYVNNGFFKTKNGKTVVDEQAVRAYYQKEYAGLIEGYKVASDDNYYKIKSYLDALREVKFAVVLHDSDAVISNTDLSSAREVQKDIAAQPMHLLLFNSREPYYTNTSMKDVAELAQQVVADYDGSFDLFVSFPKDLHFNEACDKMEETCLAMYQKVSASIRNTVLCLAAALALTVVLLLITGKREVGGKIKYAVTDRLPNELHFLFHLCILLSMISLIGSSIYSLLHPHLGVKWLTISPDFYAIRANLCTVVLYLSFLGILCSFKRHYRNHSLLKNTLIWYVIRLFRRDDNGSDSDAFSQ